MKCSKTMTITFILGIFLHASATCSGQDDFKLLMDQIKLERDKIESNSKAFKLVEEDINEQTSEGGILKKYFEGNMLRKAELTFYGETGQSTTDYYFLNGELILVHDELQMYKEPIYMGKVEIRSSDQNQYYFKNQILIIWLDNENKKVDQLKYMEKQIEILDDLKMINKDK